MTFVTLLHTVMIGGMFGRADYMFYDYNAWKHMYCTDKI